MCEMQKCPICRELIKKGNGHHIKKCMDNFINNLSEDKKNEYVSLYNSGVSIYELSTILNFSYNATVKFLKKNRNYKVQNNIRTKINRPYKK